MQFLVPIEREVKRVNKNGKEITKTISYKLKFVDNARFMASSLSNLVNSLTNEFIKLNVKVKMIIKFVKRVELKTKILFAFLNAQTLKMI